MKAKSNTYRLEELKSVIEENIPQLEKAINLHKEVYDILCNTETKYVDETYLNTLKSTIEKLETNQREYEFNLQLVNDVLQRVKNHADDEVNELDILTTMMLHLFTDIKIEEAE